MRRRRRILRFRPFFFLIFFVFPPWRPSDVPCRWSYTAISKVFWTTCRWNTCPKTTEANRRPWSSFTVRRLLFRSAGSHSAQWCVKIEFSKTYVVADVFCRGLAPKNHRPSAVLENVRGQPQGGGQKLSRRRSGHSAGPARRLSSSSNLTRSWQPYNYSD